MADTKLSALTADASPTSDDLIYTVNDPGGTPASKKVTLANVMALVLATPTVTGHPTVEGVTSTGATGTGKFVFDGTPTLVTPVLGVATVTSVNKVAITAPASSATLTIADGKTATVNHSITFAGTDSTTMTFPTTSATIARTDAANTFTGAQTMTSPVINGVTHTTGTASSPGYIGVPINSQSAAYEFVAADAGKCVLHATADNNARTFTIPSSATVAYAIGTALTVINMKNTVTIAITTDTMTLANSASTGSRTLAVNGVATAVKVETGNWIINGTGLT